jgi:hypothetical protein
MTGLADGLLNENSDKESFEILLPTRSPTLKSLSPTGYELSFHGHKPKDGVDDSGLAGANNKSIWKPKVIALPALSLADFTSSSLSSDICSSKSHPVVGVGSVFNACSPGKLSLCPRPPVVLRIEVMSPSPKRAEIIRSSSTNVNPQILPLLEKQTKRFAGVKRRLYIEDAAPMLTQNGVYSISPRSLERIQSRPPPMPMLEIPNVKRSRRKLS